jgi:hypothetical protein
VVTETDLALGDGRTLHVYDTGTGDGAAGLAVFWHHGTPNTGAPPEPLFAAAAERGLRWVSHDRPGYGGSTPRPGRDVASAAADVACVAEISVACSRPRFTASTMSGTVPHRAMSAGRLLVRPLCTLRVCSYAGSAGPISSPVNDARTSSGTPIVLPISFPPSGWSPRYWLNYDLRPCQRRVISEARAAANVCRSPSALAFVSWVAGEIAADASPGQARRHLQRAVALAMPAGSRFVDGISRVSLATLQARHGEPATALRHYERVILDWQQAGAWTPLWVTMRTLVDLLVRVGAWRDAATLYGAVASASSGAPPYGTDADRLRQSVARLRDHLTGAEFRSCIGKGEQMDGTQVVALALEAIGRAAAKA